MRDRERLVFGTAALGLAYGLPRFGSSPALMDEDYAATLVRFALSNGVTTFDTAPAYGVAEERLGRTLGDGGSVWTKIGRVDDQPLVALLEGSLQRLRRSSVELIQWHNWTVEQFHVVGVLDQWNELRRDDRVEAVGASTYGVANAQAAIHSGLFDVVQIEWNLLNQTVLRAVGEAAKQRGVALALRSVYLQGALTDEGRALPAIPKLLAGVHRARDIARKFELPLEHVALRAALDQPLAHWVLLGFDRTEQVASAIKIAEAPPLTCLLDELDLAGDPAADPRTWSSPT